MNRDRAYSDFSTEEEYFQPSTSETTISRQTDDNIKNEIDNFKEIIDKKYKLNRGNSRIIGYIDD